MDNTDFMQPLGLFFPSPTNPRSRITQAEIEGLAASIEAHGVMQPILARARAGAADHPHEAPYEIVAGHRRWRACCWLAEQGRYGDRIPAMLRALSDAEVLTLQAVENLQREDLHPLDEAEHYRRMRDQPEGMSVEGIADAVRVSVSRVYERLSLLRLVPASREAFLAEQLSLKTALQVARLPEGQQAEVTQHLANWGGEPMPPKAAAAFIRDRYMLRLASAPFDPADATLVPEAGACGACSRRTGANPQLFADITDADTCTDTRCFAAKKGAQRDRLVEELRSTGYRVLQDDEARDACTPDGRDLKPTLLRLDAVVPHHLGDTAFKVFEVLDKAKVPTSEVLAIDHPSATTAPVVAVGVHVLEGALRRIKAHREQLQRREEKAARPAPPAPAPAPAPVAASPTEGTVMGDRGVDGHAVQDDEAREAYVRQLLQFKVAPAWYSDKNASLLENITRQEERRALGILAAAEVGSVMQRDAAAGLPPHKLGQMLCMLLHWEEGVVTLPQAAYLAGVPFPFGAEGDVTFLQGSLRFRKHQEWLWSLPDEQANRLAMVLLASQEPRGDGEPMDQFTEAVLVGLEIPPAGLLATAQGVVREVIQLGALEHGKPADAKAAPKGKAKRDTGKVRPGVRYRCPATGSTWSGRGLQPRWLKEALAAGAKLSDFDVATQGGAR